MELPSLSSVPAEALHCERPKLIAEREEMRTPHKCVSEQIDNLWASIGHCVEAISVAQR